MIPNILNIGFLILLMLTSACNRSDDAALRSGASIPAYTNNTDQQNNNSGGNSNSHAASLIVSSGDAQTVSINSQASSSLTVMARGSNNLPIANSTVMFSVAGPGSVNPSIVTTDANGYASVDFTAGASIGAATVTASSAEGSAIFNLNVVSFSNYEIQVISGNNTIDNIGTTLPDDPLKVLVLDGTGFPAKNVLVVFGTQSGNGSFSGASSTVVQTNSSGFAQTVFTLGTSGTTNNVRATILSEPTIYTTFNLAGVIPANSVVDSDNSSIELSQSSSQANGSNLITVTIKARDQHNNLIPKSNQAILSDFTAGLGSWQSSSTFSYISTGTFINTFKVGTTSGNVIFSSSINGVNLTNSAVLNLNTGTPTGGMASLSIVSGNSQAVSLGHSVELPLKVLAVDSLGIPIPNSNVTFNVTSGTGTLSSSSVSTGVDGTASVNFTANGSSGTILIQASGLQGSVVFTITVNDLSGHTLSYVNEGASNGQSAFLNTTLTNPFSVLLKDSNNQPKAGTIVRFQCQSINCGTFSNGLTYLDVSTDDNGIASASYILGTTAGIYGVRALIPSQSTIYKDFSATATVDPSSSVSLANSTLSLSSGTVTADGLATVTATVVIKDSYGNTIPNSNKTVTVAPAPTNLGAWGGAGFVGNNGVYTRIYSVGNTAGEITFTGSVNGQSLTSTASNLILNPNNDPYLANTTITSLNGSIVANGTSTTTIVVTLNDQYNNQLSRNDIAVVLSASVGTLGSVSFHSATNTYRAIYTAPTSLGTGSATISVSTIGGVSVPSKSTSVTLTAGALSTTLSSFTIPTRNINTASSAQTLTVTLLDANSNPVTNATSVTITKTNLVGLTGTLANSGVATHIGNGVYTITFTSPAGTYSTSCPVATAPCVDSISASAVVGGVTYTIGSAKKVSYSNYAAITIVAAQSTFAFVSTNAGAAGLGQSTISALITLKNSSGQALAAGGNSSLITYTVAFSTPTVTITDNDNGTYTLTIPSPASSASGNLNIFVSSTNISGSPTAIYFFGAPDITKSIITLSKTTFNGADTATVSLAAYDANNFGIPTCTIPNFTTANVRFSQNGNAAFTGIVNCAVVNNVATFTQTIVRTTTPVIGFETVVVSGEFNLSGWQALSSYTTLTITPPNLAGVTINCTNISSYKDTALYVNGGTLTINSWQNGVLQTCGQASSPFTFASLKVGSSGIVTHTASTTTDAYGIDISVTGNVEIDGGGAINTNLRGYPSGYYTVTGAPAVDPNNAGTNGASHGGLGAALSTARQIYGSVSDPNFPGGGAAAGNGGGLIRISATNIIHNGSMWANGASTGAGGGQGAAGGSIKLVASGSLTGSGTIYALGGGAVYSGGGGRIAIHGNASAFPFTNISSGYTNISGVQVNTSSTMCGTLYFSQSVGPITNLIQSLVLDGSSNASVMPIPSNSNLVIPVNYSLTLGADNRTFTSITNNGTLILGSGNVTVSPGNFIQSGTNLTLGSGLLIVSNGNFTQTGGVITHIAPTYLTYSSKPRVEISAVNITVNNINVQGKGLPGGVTSSTFLPLCSNGQGYKYDNAVSLLLSCNTVGGGSHYGVGGASSGTWGNINNPNTYGGSGASTGGTTVGGGGIVRLIASNTLDIQGTINAAGANGIPNYSPGGAGGAIYLDATTVLSTTNAGSLSVAGGTGSYAGGAGGGIIKIYTANGSYTGTITNSIAGGTSSPGGYGGSGANGYYSISACDGANFAAGYCTY